MEVDTVNLQEQFDFAKANVAEWEPEPVPHDWGYYTATPKWVPVQHTPLEPKVSWFRRLLAALAAAAVLLGGVSATAPSVDATPPTRVAAVNLSVDQVLRRGDQGGYVRILQASLTNAGWPTWVDGQFGPHTEKTVKLYQQANGLLVDGIAGPQTMSHLGIWAATATQPAVRVNPPTPPATGVGPCSQWTNLAAEVGWPVDRLEWLSGIMHRESRCNPLAYNGRNLDRSYGLLQINTYGSLWGELQRRCGLTSRDQLWDARNNLACGYQLFLAYGTKPWRVG